MYALRGTGGCLVLSTSRKHTHHAEVPSCVWLGYLRPCNALLITFNEPVVLGEIHVEVSCAPCACAVRCRFEARGRCGWVITGRRQPSDLDPTDFAQPFCSSMDKTNYPDFPYRSQRDDALEYLRREAFSTDGWEKFGKMQLPEKDLADM